MRRYLPIVIFILILFIPVVCLSNRGIGVNYSNRLALVIGNGNYKYSPLKNSVNDAADIANALTELGFKVTLKINAKQKVIEQSIRDFGRKLRAGGIGLFYYAGHGIQFRGKNFLIPIGANIESEADIQYESVDAGRILTQMEEAGNKFNIIILDACRNNPFARSFRSSTQGLAKMDAPAGSILAYSTAPGGIAADGAGRNGLYTSKLLKYMAVPGMEIGRLFRNVRAEVVAETNMKQVPWESSSLIGEFYFTIDISKTTTANALSIATEKEKPKIQQLSSIEKESEYELLYWESIKDSKEPSLFSSYLKKYPNGAFVEIAKVKEKQYAPKTASVEKTTRVSTTFRTGQRRTAILPGIFWNDADRDKDIILSNISEAIGNFSYLSLTDSFYKIDDKINTINENQLDIDNLWTKEKRIKVPNVPYIIKFGKKIKVDLVLIFDVDFSYNYTKQDMILNNFKAFLIDINRNKMLSEEYVMGKPDDIKSVVSKLISKFEK